MIALTYPNDSCNHLWDKECNYCKVDILFKSGAVITVRHDVYKYAILNIGVRGS